MRRGQLLLRLAALAPSLVGGLNYLGAVVWASRSGEARWLLAGQGFALSDMDAMLHPDCVNGTCAAAPQVPAAAAAAADAGADGGGGGGGTTAAAVGWGDDVALVGDDPLPPFFAGCAAADMLAALFVPLAGLGPHVLGATALLLLVPALEARREWAWWAGLLVAAVGVCDSVAFTRRRLAIASGAAAASPSTAATGGWHVAATFGFPFGATAVCAAVLWAHRGLVMGQGVPWRVQAYDEESESNKKVGDARGLPWRDRLNRWGLNLLDTTTLMAAAGGLVAYLYLYLLPFELVGLVRDPKLFPAVLNSTERDEQARIITVGQALADAREVLSPTAAANFEGLIAASVPMAWATGYAAFAALPKFAILALHDHDAKAEDTVASRRHLKRRALFALAYTAAALFLDTAVAYFRRHPDSPDGPATVNGRRIEEVLGTWRILYAVPLTVGVLLCTPHALRDPPSSPLESERREGAGTGAGTGAVASPAPGRRKQKTP